VSERLYVITFCVCVYIYIYACIYALNNAIILYVIDVMFIMSS
jgi:hypothetical protein